MIDEQRTAQSGYYRHYNMKIVIADLIHVTQTSSGDINYVSKTPL